MLFEPGQRQPAGGVAGDVAHVLQEAEEGGQHPQLPSHLSGVESDRLTANCMTCWREMQAGEGTWPSVRERNSENGAGPAVGVDGDGRAASIALQIVEEHLHRLLEGERIGSGRGRRHGQGVGLAAGGHGCAFSSDAERSLPKQGCEPAHGRELRPHIGMQVARGRLQVSMPQ